MRQAGKFHPNRIRQSFQATLLVILTVTIFSLLSGCSSVKPENYAKQKPELKLFDYFQGKTYAWGQFKDRSGKVIRRFRVDISGEHSGDRLTLDERFLYDDGERQTRVWRIARLEKGLFSGEADDVVGKAEGRSAGNALNWRYTLQLPYKNSHINVQFDDWMFLHENGIMINQAAVKKFGFQVGEVTLFFSKQKPEDWGWL